MKLTQTKKLYGYHMKKENCLGLGMLSIILGIIGLILYFIGLFFFSFVNNRLYGMVIGFILSILALVFGYIAYKKGDSYGIYGMILGGFVIIMAVIIAIITTPTYFEIVFCS